MRRVKLGTVAGSALGWGALLVVWGLLGWRTAVGPGTVLILIGLVVGAVETVRSGHSHRTDS